MYSGKAYNNPGVEKHNMLCIVGVYVCVCACVCIVNHMCVHCVHMCTYVRMYSMHI